jgi:hypothetical protein
MSNTGTQIFSSNQNPQSSAAATQETSVQQSNSSASTISLSPSNLVVRDILDTWNESQELLLKTICERSNCMRWLHTQCISYYDSLHFCLTIPNIIITTVNGSVTMSISSLFTNPNDQQTALTVVGLISLFSAALLTINQYIKSQQMSESHRIASIAYSKLYRTIMNELALRRDQRVNGLDFLNIVRSEIDRLESTSPSVLPFVIRKFNKKFLKNSIEKPEITGDLDEVYINTTSQKPDATTQNPDATTQNPDAISNSLIKKDELPTIAQSSSDSTDCTSAFLSRLSSTITPQYSSSNTAKEQQVQQVQQVKHAQSKPIKPIKPIEPKLVQLIQPEQLGQPKPTNPKPVHQSFIVDMGISMENEDMEYTIENKAKSTTSSLSISSSESLKVPSSTVPTVLTMIDVPLVIESSLESLEAEAEADVEAESIDSSSTNSSPKAIN